MHEDGPNALEGPVRGSSAWWRLTAPEPAAPTEPVASMESGISVESATSLRSAKDIRHDLVDRIRKEIAAGTYDTPEKWDAALCRLLDRLV